MANLSAEPNKALANSAAVLAVITAAAIGIERFIEGIWTIIGQLKDAWWPFNLMGSQVNGLVGDLGSVVGFGLIVEKTGLFVSTGLLIFCASTASNEFRWKEALASSAKNTPLAIAVFVLGLKIQLPVWPAFLSGML